MTCQSRFRRASAILAVLWLLRSALSGGDSTHSDPATPDELELLDQIDRGSVTKDSIKIILAGVSEERFGTRYRLGYILGRAVNEGAMPKAEAMAGIVASGCSFGDAPQSETCRRLVSQFVLASTKARNDAAPKSASALQSRVNEARATLLKATKEPGYAVAGPQLQYAQAVLAAKERPLNAALEYYEVNSVGQIADPGDRIVYEALYGAGNDGHPARVGSPVAFAAGFAAAFRLRVHDSEGSPEVVADVRSISPENLARAKRHGAEISEPFLDGSVGCVVESWRKHEHPPSQWLAWEELLKCQGW